MFCPECGAEYREGFTECADCKVPLVPELELPPEPRPERVVEYVDYECVLSTFNPGDVALIKSIMDSEKLTYFFHGEHFHQVRPLIEPAKLMVRKNQVQRARDILKHLEPSFMPFPTRRESEEDERA
jgi:hypothetical protein